MVRVHTGGPGPRARLMTTAVSTLILLGLGALPAAAATGGNTRNGTSPSILLYALVGVGILVGVGLIVYLLTRGKGKDDPGSGGGGGGGGNGFYPPQGPPTGGHCVEQPVNERPRAYQSSKR
jgi:hypothetical protein